MAIVRELLVRLGFQTDKRAINQANQAITGFRTRFAFVAAAATYAFSRIGNFFNDIAKATLASDDLAKSLGVSLGELTKIQGAAQKVGRLDFRQTAAAIQKVQDLMISFRQGISAEFANIARDAGVSGFFLDPKGDAIENFKTILQYLGSIKVETERIRIAENIFGKDLKNRISDLAVEFDKFEKSIPDFEQVGKDAENSLQSFKDYQDAINSLTAAWTNLTLKLSQTVIPLLTNISNILAGLSDVYLGLFSLDLSTLKQGANAVSKALDPLFNATGLYKVPEFIKSGKAKETLDNVIDYTFNPSLYSPDRIRDTLPNVTMNTEFNIKVPEGTDQQSAQYISEEVGVVLRDSFYNMLQNIQNNNPVIE